MKARDYWSGTLIPFRAITAVINAVLLVAGSVMFQTLDLEVSGVINGSILFQSSRAMGGS
jgi:hypothetical protein